MALYSTAGCLDWGSNDCKAWQSTWSNVPALSESKCWKIRFTSSASGVSSRLISIFARRPWPFYSPILGHMQAFYVSDSMTAPKSALLDWVFRASWNIHGRLKAKLPYLLDLKVSEARRDGRIDTMASDCRRSWRCLSCIEQPFINSNALHTAGCILQKISNRLKYEFPNFNLLRYDWVIVVMFQQNEVGALLGPHFRHKICYSGYLEFQQAFRNERGTVKYLNKHRSSLFWQT